MDERNGQDGQGIGKTFKYRLTPTPEQEVTLEFLVRGCRARYNAALQERKEAWEKRRVNVTAASQSAQLPEIKDIRPDYCGIHSQALQDVLTRLDRAFQAFFRRVKSAAKPGILGSRVRIATSRSPTSNSATGPPSTTGSWSCPRLAGSPSGGRAR
ncbi:MAG TPA: transposase [Ktedonobacterales bacterium]|nr:transposase [Ktedonobacterales bacterium]